MLILFTVIRDRVHRERSSSAFGTRSIRNALSGDAVWDSIDGHGEDRLTLLSLVDKIAELAHEAADYAKTEGRERTSVTTLSAALVRAVAKHLNIAPSRFRQLVQPVPDGWRIIFYDDLEGGSGNAAALRDSLKHWVTLDSDIASALQCPAASGDRVLERILNSGRSADALAFLRTEARGIGRANERRVCEQQGPSRYVPASGEVASVRHRLHRASPGDRACG